MGVVSRVLLAVLLIVVVLLALIGIGLVALKLIDWSQHTERVAGLVERFTPWQVERLSDLEVDLYFPMRIRLEDFALVQTDPTSTIASVEGAAAAVSLDPLSILKGRLVIHDLRTADTRLQFKTPSEPPEPPEEEQLPYLASAEIRNARFIYPREEAEPLTATITRLDVTGVETADRVTLAGNGTLQSLPFALEGELGLDADDGTAPVPISLEARLAGGTVTVGGLAGASRAFDLAIRATGDNMGRIANALDVEVGEALPYDLAMSVMESDGRLLLPELTVTVGESRIVGEASVDTEAEPPEIRAKLTAERLRHADIAALLPADEEEAEKEGPLFSREPLPFDTLHDLDAMVELAIDSYVGADVGRALGALVVEARLEAGKLTIKPVELTVADGTLGGGVLVNAANSPSTMAADMSLDRVNLPTLLAPFVGDRDASEIIGGTLSARIEMKTAGESPHQLASGLDGGVVFVMQDGAIMQALVEAAGLDIFEALGNWLGDNSLTDIQCAIGIFDIESGVVSIEQLLLATADSNIVGEGMVDLGRETLDITLEAHAKDFSFGAGDTPVQLTGSFSDLNVDVMSDNLASSLVGSTLLAIVNPLLAVIPLFEGGHQQGSRCEDVTAELEQVVRASEKQADQPNATPGAPGEVE